jgi:hypothetical protein
MGIFYILQLREWTSQQRFKNIFIDKFHYQIRRSSIKLSASLLSSWEAGFKYGYSGGENSVLNFKLSEKEEKENEVGSFTFVLVGGG